MRALGLALGWLGGYYLLAQYGVYLLPQAIAQRTTLPQYLAMVQIVSVLLGVSGLLFATRRSAGLREKFFPELAPGHRLRPSPLVVSVLLGPLLFLAAYGLGMYFALDTLLLELAARGAKAVQAQTGELGRTAQADTLWTIFPFTVLLAPLGEELLFRGGIYGGIQAFVESLPTKNAEPEAPPPSLEIAGLPKKKPLIAEGVCRWLKSGGFALFGSAFCFGALHADTDGGMGIVRVVSATLLGLACGFARTKTGTLFAPLALHATYNLISLGALRGWLVFESFPTKYTIPTALGPLSLVGATIALGIYFTGKHRRGTPSA